jgi:hypothetical protein
LRISAFILRPLSQVTHGPKTREQVNRPADKRCFLPDVVLAKDGNRFGAICHPDLRLAHQQSRFIEDGRVPFDAHIVDHTWQYTNKRGGPDRRFNNNRQLPVGLYDTLHFSTSSGRNELFEVSRLGVADTLAAALDDMRVIAPVSEPSTTAAEQPLRPTPSGPHPVRIPTIATTHSSRSRPPVPIDRDQCDTGARSAAGCSR